MPDDLPHDARACWAPCGQYKVSDAEWRNKREVYKSDSSAWVREHSLLMSFELWCSLTGYKALEPGGGGGTVFQELMHYLLTYGYGIDVKIGDKLQSDYYIDKPGSGWKHDAETQHLTIYAGGNVVGGKVNEQKYNKAQLHELAKERGYAPDIGYDEDGNEVEIMMKKADAVAWILAHPTDEQKEYMHSPTTQAVNVQKGGHQGNNSSDAYGFFYGGQAGGGSYEVPASRQPCGKTNWLQVGNTKQKLSAMAHGKQKAGSATLQGYAHGPEAQFATNGDLANKNCKEKTGCMATANITASIFGLYYYPGCDDDENNWIVKQVIDGKTYSIRMRMWNPNYTMENGWLIVKEKLNSKAKGTHRIVGGPHGFAVPNVYQEKGVPMEPWLMIKDNSDKRTRLAPFFGSVKKAGRISAMTDKPYLLCEYLYEKWGDLIHRPSNGLYFGFNVPKAHWLYPHYTPDEDEYEKQGNSYDQNAEHGTGYQLWPVWQSKYNTEANRNTIMSIHLFFVEDLPSEMHARRQYALRGSVTDTVVQTSAPHVDVNVVLQEEDDPLPPTDTGDHTDGAIGPPEFLTDGTSEEMTTTVREEAALDIAFTSDVNLMAQDIGSTLEFEGGTWMPAGSKELDAKLNEVAGGKKVYVLDEGAAYAHNDANPHFMSTAHQPWAHRDIYAKPTLQIEAGEIMDEAALDAYKEKYGSTHNLYLRGETIPKKINAIKQNYGLADMSIMNSSITSDTPLHRRNLCRILAIYFYQGGIGKKKKEEKGKQNPKGKAQKAAPVAETSTAATRKQPKRSKKNKVAYFPEQQPEEQEDDDEEIVEKQHDSSTYISYESKRRGMLHGVWARDEQPMDVNVPRMYDHIRFGNDPSTNKVKWHLLWPPVFKTAPEDVLKKLRMKTADMLRQFDIELLRGDDTLIEECLLFDNNDLLSGEHKLQSDMTVLQWVTSPWHYAFLPYRQHNALFKDGETYSEGCTRCSRPFHEFEHMYSAYKKSEVGTQHWPTLYWQVGINKQLCGRGCAPLPFHYEKFWSANQVKAKGVVAASDSVELPGYDDGGWHNWPTYQFMLLKDNSYHLSYEAHKRLQKDTPLYNQLVADDNGRATFRRFINHVWDADRVSIWGATNQIWDASDEEKEKRNKYPIYAQSRLTNGRARMGTRNYYLQRAAKYGNTCKDCAATLDLAPGLFMRNHRKITDTGLVVGNTKKAESTGNTWWTNLIGRVGNSEDLMNFDPDALHARVDKTNFEDREQFLKSFESSMEIFSSYLQSYHKFDVMHNTTKYKSPPDIYVQKVVKLPGTQKKKDKGNAAKTERQLLQKAIRDLRLMLDEPTKLNQVDTSNPAFRDMVFELERKYVHKDRFTPSSKLKVFDSEMKRLEIRNKEIKVGNKTWHNCLVVRQYTPTTKNVTKTKTFITAEQYEEKIYYASRNGKNGDCEPNPPTPTMWCGDGYVTEYDDEKGIWTHENNVHKNNQLKQWRTLRQSRLFITYSLHRPLQDEIVARGVLEKMAGAAHELFGNDMNLSELLVFGWKLGGFTKKKESSDTIGKAHFELIGAPNKKDKLPDFYGESGKNSYSFDTYETHVESVSVDGGIEIGPQRFHPHFHILLTVNHWSYVQIDYFKMNSYLEMMFTGIDPLQRGWGKGDKDFRLDDSSGGDFYTDNENPYVDIKLYPQDNWNEILAAYVRKSATPGPIEALGARTGMKK